MSHNMPLRASLSSLFEHHKSHFNKLHWACHFTFEAFASLPLFLLHYFEQTLLELFGSNENKKQQQEDSTISHFTALTSTTTCSVAILHAFCCSKFLRMLLQLLRPAPLFYGSVLLYCIDHNLRQHMLNGGHKLYAAVSFTLFAFFPLTFFVVSALNILQWQPGSINVNIDIRSTLTAPDLA